MQKNEAPVPSGKLARGKTVGIAVARVGAKKLAHATKRVLLGKASQEKADARFNEDSARLIFEALVTLRGSALKVAQLLSLEMDLLPEPYQKELSKSCYRVPPLNRALARKMFIAGLGKSPEDVFAEFDYDAFAAASLGQVHKAVLRDGRPIAVKLQYPGIRQSLRSDLAILRGLVAAVPQTQKGKFGAALEEIETRLLEEADYFIEAENTKIFHKFLASASPNITTPETHPDFCSGTILTTSLLPGAHMDEWLATKPAQKERDKAAQEIFEANIGLFYELNTIHADPNPGNYLFGDGDKVGLLDFGCVKKLTPGFVGQYKRFLRAITGGSKKEIIECCRNFELISNNNAGDVETLYENLLRPFNEWVALPYKTDFFDFNKNPDYCSKGREFYSAIANHKSKTTELNPNFIFVDRTRYGLYRIFEKLGARVAFKNKWEFERL